MMHAYEVIEILSTASSRARKEQIINEAYSQNCFDFFEAVQLAADPFIHFGVKKVAEIFEDDGDPGDFSFADFRQLCNLLRTQPLSDEEARQVITAAAERCHTNTWNQLYRRVLLKDLRAVDITMVNRLLKRLGPVASALQVPTFRCQTATHSGVKPETGRFLVDTEIPGQRTFALLDKTVWALDTDGKPRDMPDAVMKPLRHLASNLPGSIVFDGVVNDGGEYLVCDIIPMEDFRAKFSPRPQEHRRAALESLYLTGVFAETAVRVTALVDVNLDTHDGRQKFHEYAQLCAGRGFHTLVLKKPDAPYQAKQTRAWMTWHISFT